jgi:hypothetical protein
VLVGSNVGGGVFDGVVVGRAVDVDAGIVVGDGVMVRAGSGVLSWAVQAASRKNRTNSVEIFILFRCDFISIDIGLQ